jgi:16S rRNA (cytosine1402-N4)-methyltransferase
MKAIMVPDTAQHYPVLLNELISIITPQHGGTFIFLKTINSFVFFRK